MRDQESASCPPKILSSAKNPRLGLGGVDASGVLCESLGRGEQVRLRGGPRGHRLHTVVLGLRRESRLGFILLMWF